MISARVSALALAATLGFAAVSHAQPAPPPPGMAMHHWRHGDEGDARAAIPLKALHDAVNIRPDQERAFQAFAASMRPPHPGSMGPSGDHGQGMDGADTDNAMDTAVSMTAPDRADQMVKRFDEHTGKMREALVRHAEALKTLYAILSPEQRRTFDAVALLMGHPGGGMRGPMGGMGHGPLDD